MRQVTLAKPVKRARKAKRPLRRKAKRRMKLHHADALFSQYIRQRDGWACRVCGSAQRIQCGHVISRRYHAIRFNPANAVALCSRCHMKYTRNPLAWEAWVEERFPGRLGMLKAQALAAHEHPDFDALCESLRLAIGGG
jgi:hypothetical protein